MDESTGETIPSRSKQRWKRSKKSRGEYAADRRLALLKLLAPPVPPSDCGQCDSCELLFPYSKLTIDHRDGRTWEMSSLNRWSRIARMWKEHLAGVRLRALCNSCNGREGGGRRYHGARP